MPLKLTALAKKYGMKIEGVLHIGAHYGQENEVYDHLQIPNRVFFEPLKKNFEVLSRKIGTRYPLMNIALGNENKQILMNVEAANDGQSSSILKPAKHLKQYPHIKFDTTEEVSMCRLDDLGLDIDTKFNLLVIDVQGYELEVLKGSVNVLTKIDYIISEINRDELYENCTQLVDLKSFLSLHGFVLVEESWDGKTWGDGLFIKRDKYYPVEEPVLGSWESMKQWFNGLFRKG